MKEKVVLAYSGGLDTTAIIPWLKETYDYEVICCCIDCGQEEELDGLEERAKLSGASFTVSNLGAFGITSFTPIINPPQTGILGVCNIEYKVRMKNGQPEFYPAINLSLTYDHRAMDGAPASRFLQALGRNLENFDLLLAK